MDQLFINPENPTSQCFLCLSAFSEIENTTGKDEKISFKMLMRYLNTSILSMEEEPEVKFCAVCIPLMMEFLEWYKNLEAVRLCLNNCVQTLSSVMEKNEENNLKSDGNQKVSQGWENLRKNTIMKCHAKLLSKPVIKIPKVVVHLDDLISGAQIDTEGSSTFDPMDISDSVTNEVNKPITSILSIEPPAFVCKTDGNDYSQTALPQVSTAKTDDLLNDLFHFCPMCPASFSTKDELFSHGRIHANHSKPLPFPQYFEPYSKFSLETRVRDIEKSMPLEVCQFNPGSCMFPKFNYTSPIKMQVDNDSQPPSVNPEVALWPFVSEQVFPVSTPPVNLFQAYQSNGQNPFSSEVTQRVPLPKSHHCKFCPKSTALLGDLRTHQFSTHLLQLYSDKVGPETTEKQLKSAVRLVANKNTKLNIISRRHSTQTQKRLGCPFCAKTYAKIIHLKMHIVKFHMDKVVQELEKLKVTPCS